MVAAPTRRQCYCTACSTYIWQSPTTVQSCAVHASHVSSRRRSPGLACSVLQLEALTAPREGRYRRLFSITINTSGTEMKGQPAPNHWLARPAGRGCVCPRCVCTLVMSIAGVRGREKRGARRTVRRGTLSTHHYQQTAVHYETAHAGRRKPTAQLLHTSQTDGLN